MAPMVHLVSHTQSNLFGSQTPMSHLENREARTLLPSNQWTITTLDKSNQYCSKYWTLRWWKNTQSHAHNSLTPSFLRLSRWVGPACLVMISRVPPGGREGSVLRLTGESIRNDAREGIPEGWIPGVWSLCPLWQCWLAWNEVMVLSSKPTGIWSGLFEVDETKVTLTTVSYKEAQQSGYPTVRPPLSPSSPSPCVDCVFSVGQHSVDCHSGLSCPLKSLFVYFKPTVTADVCLGPHC